MPLSPREMRALFQQTVVVRRPTFGIVSGYHELPYVCLGQAFDPAAKTTEVRGRVQVSPRFIIRPPHLEPSYAEIFGSDHVDVELAGRMFGFLGFSGKPVECKSEYLDVTNMESSIDEMLSRTLNELDRREDITTGVIITPDPRYFPVSIERFISTVIEDEFRA